MVKTRRLACVLAVGWMAGGAWAQMPGRNLAAGASAAVTAGGGAALPMPAAAPAVTRIFPLAEVKRGQMGVAYTVFEGVTPEPMQVEILGVLKNSLGPGRDLILARLRGQKPEYTGVVAGMSGSPVYIDGRLVGALSYRIGQFSKEPIAGITPIESMLEVRDEDGAGAAANGTKETGHGQTLNTGGLPVRQSQGQNDEDHLAGNGVAGAIQGQPEMQAMETPLVFGGFSQETVERFGDRFRAMGLTPVAGLGGADPEATQPEPLVPGSAVSAVLVRGDLTMAGTCTVTYIDPKRLLACGHPISQYGQVDMPMTKAEVITTLASPLNAFKIINTTETVGAFTEDRASAILGRLGAKARMIPVVVEVVPPADGGVPGKVRTFHFEVLDNRQLTPSAMLVSVYQTLHATNTEAADMSYRLTGEMTVDGLPAVRLDGVMAQNDFNSGAINAALFVNDRFSRVYGNALQQPVVTGLRVKLKAMPERRTAVLETARLSTMEARAGDTIEVEATLHPYQADARVVWVKVKLPAVLTPGPMRVVVSDGATVDRLTTPSGTPHAMGLADTVAALNRMHANDRVYVTLLDHAAQAVLEGQALPAVPLSMANVLEPLKAQQKMQLTGESVVEAGSAEAGYAVAGSQVLDLQIRQ
jgi:hypothetical protein